VTKWFRHIGRRATAEMKSKLERFAGDSLRADRFLELARLGTDEKLPVHQPDATVDDRLFHGFKPLLAANDKLAQKENKVSFQGEGVVSGAYCQSVLCLLNKK
jgi:hypothetical protein